MTSSPSARSFDELSPFGGRLSPHGLFAEFRGGSWSELRLEPVHDLELAPQTRVLHYAQSVFEGFKAHRQTDGSVALFRPGAHLARFESSLARLCLPPIDTVALLARIRALVARDRDHVPLPPSSLYVRPLVFADDTDLVAGPGTNATLLVVTAPVPLYFDGSRGLRLRTETRYVRAFPGGTGAIKAAGNYAAAMIAQAAARAEGYDEVVWLDALERSFVEETGAMNLFVVRAGELWTPPTGDTVLPGITRASLLRLAHDRGLAALEERIPIAPDWWRDVTEVFSSGTAVGCAPIASIEHEGFLFFDAPEPGPVQRALSAALMDLKEGRAADPYGWRSLC